MNTENVGGLSLKSGFWEIRPAFKDDPHDPRGLHLSRSGVGLARDSQGRIYDRVRIIFASLPCVGRDVSGFVYKKRAIYVGMR